MKNKNDPYLAALRLFKYKMQSEYEIIFKLKNKGFSSEEINTTIDKLKSFKYINDEKLAKDLFDFYKNQHLLSNKMIHYKLKQKGLYINENLSEKDELLSVKKIVCIKSRISKKYSDDPNKMKQFLMRKGFSLNIINKVIK